jgi:RNA polymerase sigma-70 factor (ECF subfamily)
VPDDNIQDDNIRRLYQYIGGLNEMDRALMLLYLDDRTYREIAEIMGISETNVGTKLSRIKNSLKESLKTSKM